MSHDQRPGRMRVVAGQPKGAASQSTALAVVGDAASVDAAAAGSPGTAAKRGGMVMPAAIFLFACIVGGAMVAFLHGAGTL